MSTTSLAPGARLGPYEITASIGEGGMGHVYRARDGRLGRDVAIKVLPPAFAQDPERRARFEREAQTVATLSHPHIVSIFDTGRLRVEDATASQGHVDQLYVVMELLEGQTLRERLANGPLPARKAIEAAVQVARGLAAAHDKGLVHRDLKPDNIFLLADGHVKILDFGLARASANRATGSGATETVAALTDPGLVMGTVGYMSPEQVRGHAVDARTDLFAFGAVLYEMLTGKRAFGRDTAADAMSAILKEDAPELAGTRADLSPALDRIIRHCLEKNPVERFQSARDVAFALEALTGSGSVGSAGSGSGRGTLKRALPWAVAVVALASVGYLAATRPAPVAPASAMRFQVTLEASNRSLTLNIAVAPDGHALVVQTLWTSGDTRLHLRRLDSMDFTALPGTEAGASPFWSPDSKSVAFVANGTLKRYDLATSSVRPICQAPSIFLTGAWGRGDTILFNVPGVGLNKVPANGGTPAIAVAQDAAKGELVLLRPVFLPDGSRFFYSARRSDGQLVTTMLASLDSDRRAVLPGEETYILWAGDDAVVFRRGDSIYAQDVNYDTPALVGEPTLLAANLDTLTATALRDTVSDTGVLAMADRRNRQGQFTWYGRNGARLGPVGPAGEYYTFDLSNDGTRIVASLRSAQDYNLWVIDTAHDTTTRMTLVAAQDTDPRWAPDATSVVFASTRDALRSLHRAGVAADTPKLLWKHAGRLMALDDWSRDGRWLIFHEAGGLELQAQELDATGALKGQPVVVARALTGIMDQAQLSPDGKWVAYNSNESGRYEVYVAPFPATGTRVPVSRAGGVQPTWRGDGSELYFLTLDGVLMASRVTTTAAAFAASEPVKIVQPRLPSAGPQIEQYAPHPTGTKFLVLDQVGEERNLSLSVLTNWRALMR